MGDFNARTATLPDYIMPADRSNHNELNINEESDISIRASYDPTAKDYGKLLCNVCMNFSMLISNERNTGDLNGHFT